MHKIVSVIKKIMNISLGRDRVMDSKHVSSTSYIHPYVPKLTPEIIIKSPSTDILFHWIV